MNGRLCLTDGEAGISLAENPPLNYSMSKAYLRTIESIEGDGQLAVLLILDGANIAVDDVIALSREAALLLLTFVGGRLDVPCDSAQVHEARIFRGAGHGEEQGDGLGIAGVTIGGRGNLTSRGNHLLTDSVQLSLMKFSDLLGQEREGGASRWMKLVCWGCWFCCLLSYMV